MPSAARWLAAATVLTLVACGGDGAAPTPPELPDPPRPVALTVAPDSLLLESLGATGAFTATVTDQYGAAYPGTVAWSSSDRQVVEAGTGGVVTAVSNGTATVVASLEGLSDSATVAVRQRPAAVEVASGDGQEGRPGRTLAEPVVVRVEDAGGSPVEGVEVSFAGDGAVEPATAVSDSAGIVQAVWTLAEAEGAQALTATVPDGPTAQITATAEPFPLVSLTVSEASAPEGATIELTVEISPAPKLPLSVAYTLAPDGDASTADADSADYAGGAMGTVEIAAGEETSVVRVAVLDDDQIEPTREVLAVSLDAPLEADDYRLGEQVSAAATILEGVCDRTPQVREEITRATGTSDGCASVADEDLAAIGELRVRGPENADDDVQAIAALKAGDFGGLGSLELLDLGRNRLETLPVGVFGELAALQVLRLDSNRLDSLVQGVFGGLAAVQVLDLSGNRLPSVPDGIFGGLATLEELDLSDNVIGELSRSGFGGLSALRRIDLSGNTLTELPPGLLADGGEVEEVRFGDNEIEALPENFFAATPQLVHVGLEGNRIDSLPQGVFQGLARLSKLHLEGNRLAELPAGFFEGLVGLTEVRLHDNPGAPFPVALELERADTTNLLAPGPAAIVLRVEGGAPFEVAVDASVENGTASAASFAVSVGESRSAETVVTRTARSREPTLFRLEEAPGVPEGYSGLELRVGPSLVLFAKPDNEAPTVRATVPDHVMQLGGPIVRWDAQEYFDDDDLELVYSASASNSSVVSAEVNGAEIVLTATGGGGTTVTVTVTDPSGESASQHFEASVIGSPHGGAFEIDMLVVGGLEARERLLWQAARRWEGVMAADLPEVRVEDEFTCFGDRRRYATILDDLLIFAIGDDIDGAGGILASAGVCGVREGSNLPVLAMMIYDTNDLDHPDFYSLVLHEMGHALGIGVLWELFGLLANPASQEAGADTHFTGPLAVAAFDDIGGLRYAGAKVPVENQAGPGSRDTHWRYSVFGSELMNPYLFRNQLNPLSAVTIQSLADMGYQVDVGAADSFVLPSAAAVREPPGPVVEVGDDILRGPVVVIGKDGRVTRELRR